MKSAKRAPRPTREDDDAEVRSRRHELFELVFPLARRAARARWFASLKYSDLDRDDIEQEVLLDVWHGIRRFDESRSSLRTFVESVVANRIASILRRSRAVKRTQPAEYGRLVESLPPLVTVELRLDIDGVLATLRHPEREVAALLEEYRPAEIARVLAIPRSAVYRSIQRIRKAFVNTGFKYRIRAPGHFLPNRRI